MYECLQLETGEIDYNTELFVKLNLSSNNNLIYSGGIWCHYATFLVEKV